MVRLTTEFGRKSGRQKPFPIYDYVISELNKTIYQFCESYKKFSVTFKIPI